MLCMEEFHSHILYKLIGNSLLDRISVLHVLQSYLSQGEDLDQGKIRRSQNEVSRSLLILEELKARYLLSNTIKRPDFLLHKAT